MARKQKRRDVSTTTPGAKNRVGTKNMLVVYDPESGEVAIKARWRRCGHIYVEHAKHLKPKVVPDTNS